MESGEMRHLVQALVQWVGRDVATGVPETREADGALDASLAGLRRRWAPQAQPLGPPQQCGFAGRGMWVRGAGSTGGFAPKRTLLASLSGI
jgi:hypothetical protein